MSHSRINNSNPYDQEKNSLIASFNNLSTSFNQRLFKPISVSPACAAVLRADYLAIPILIANNPMQMLEPSLQLDGSYKSPLQIALYNYDTYTWRLIYKACKSDMSLLEKFCLQAKEQVDHINFDPLFYAYQQHDATYQRYSALQAPFEEVKIAWENVIKAQEATLPAHIINDFCRKDFSWSNNNHFGATLPLPTNTITYIHSTGDIIDLYSNTFNATFGKCFGLLRGNKNDAYLVSDSPGIDSTRTDHEIFFHLCHARIAEYQNLMKNIPKLQDIIAEDRNLLEATDQISRFKL